MSVTIDTKQLDDLVARKLRFIANPGAALDRVGAALLRSVQRNFREGGRPKWKPSKERARNRAARIKLAAKNLKEGTNKASKGQKTLRDTGRLMNSIAYEVTGNKVIMGTNTLYAKILHFGGTINHPGGTPYISLGPDGVIFMRKSTKFTPGKKTKAQRGTAKIKKSLKAGNEVKYTRAHKITIPARPFLMIQPEDYNTIRRIITDEVLKA